MKKYGQILVAGLGIAMALQGGAALAAPAPTDAEARIFQPNDPAVQMNRTRDYLERARVAQQIAEDKAKAKAGIESQQQQEAPEAPALAFELKTVVWDPSQIITAEELEAIAAKYLGPCNLEQLYKMVAEVNNIYSQKGYITCKAFLGPQTIKEGAVKITIIEGRNGNVAVQGNKHTKANYIKDRLSLPAGEIMSLKALNKDLLHFNGTNDVQLRIALQAGTEPGTTDYVITAYEPQQQVITVYSDNNGNETSGEYRAGLFYNNRSLTGVRDNLMVSLMGSEGTKAVAASYAYPVGHSGTKLRLQYSTNSVEITDGQLEPLGVKGHAYAAAVGITQPLAISEKQRSELTLDLSTQNSKTSFAGNPWLDDTASGVALGYAVTNYGKSHILYRKLSYTFGGYENIKSESKNYNRLNSSTMYQKLYDHGQQLNVRFDGQLGFNNYLPSSQQFYIGGAYSVRGYKESALSGDRGYALGLEYSIPVFNKDTSAFVFLDHGKVGGDSSFDDNSLTGAGFGIKTTFKKKIYGSLTLGFPLEKDLNGSDVDSTRLHFVVSGQF